MGKNNIKAQRKAAFNKREEEKAKKVLRNVIIGLVVIAVGIIAVAALVKEKIRWGCFKHPHFHLNTSRR